MTEESANQLLRIPVRIFPYGPPHTDCLIRTDISSHYDPNDLYLYYYSVQSYNKRFINRVHVPNFGGLSGSEDKGGSDNSIQFMNFWRVGDKSFN